MGLYQPHATTFTHYGRLFDGNVFQNATRDEWLLAHPAWGVIKESQGWAYVARCNDKGKPRA